MAMKTYHAGIYCRLSVDDTNNSAKAKGYIPADESVSIENQKKLLSKFVALNGWVEAKTYIDDGFSGGNFQRPGFQEMLEDAKSGVINLILVKDLSRLGRDYVEVGRYTDVVFPSLGCRFVSVLDCLDTEGGNTDMLHFRSLMNDYHLRDLSSKIKSVLYSKKAGGQFAVAYAPYGYRKSPEDKHKLAVDEYAAVTVRRIFEMRLAGTSYAKIAAALNTEGIASPRDYRYHLAGKGTGGIPRPWTDLTVKAILRNEVYMGNLCMNHTGSRSYKDHTHIRKPKSQWIRHENAHEAIIPSDTWKKVQPAHGAAIRRPKGSGPPTPKLFSGKLVCTGCQSKLCAGTETQHRKNGTVKKYVSYSCRKYTRSGKSVCAAHRIYEMALAQIVAAEIRAHAQAVTFDEAAVVHRLKQRADDYNAQRMDHIRREAGKLRRRVQELENLAAKLYEDKCSGAVNETTFRMLMQKNEQERITKAGRLDALLCETGKEEKETGAIQSRTAAIRKYLGLQELDQAVIGELVDHIEVGEGTAAEGVRRQEIKVFYRFSGLVM